jgi:hypothetical protein
MPAGSPAGLVKFQVDYAIAGGNEIAVNSFAGLLGGDGLVNTWEGAQDVADGLKTAWAAGWNAGLKACVASTAYVKDLKVYVIDPATGDARDEGVATWASSDLPGTGTTGMLPPTQSLVIQLWGYDPAGFAVHRRRKRGRVFLPAIAQAGVGSDGMVQSTYQDSARAGMVAFVAAANAITLTGADFTLGVYSRADQAVHPVQAVSVSNHFGSQTRRQNALIYTHNTPTSV